MSMGRISIIIPVYHVEKYLRAGPKYIQTRHSTLRLKMIEKDAEDTLPAHYIQMAKRDSAQLDYLLAGSKISRQIFERAFWYKGKIVNTGTPQCDIFLRTEHRYRIKCLSTITYRPEAMWLYIPPHFVKIMICPYMICIQMHC